MDKLISAGKISDWDHALGLYVFGRTDSDLKQLANTIHAEKRTHQLRIATIDSILSLVELGQDSQISPDEAVTLLRPGGVFVEDTVRLLTRIASMVETQNEPELSITTPKDIVDVVVTSEKASPPKKEPAPANNESPLYLLTPVSNDAEATARETISGFLEAGWYVFGDRTPGRKKLKPGDRICFYESGVGVVAHAEVASAPEQKVPPVEQLKNLDKFPWAFRLKNARMYFDDPVIIDAERRAQLDAFAQKDPLKHWAWFVQGTHQISAADYALLTRRNSAND